MEEREWARRRGDEDVGVAYTGVASRRGHKRGVRDPR